jgi:hypothetical protein
MISDNHTLIVPALRVRVTSSGLKKVVASRDGSPDSSDQGLEILS